MLNREVIVSESLYSLKNTLSACRGHLTKCYRELNELMSDPNKYKEIIARRAVLDDIFQSYKEASITYGGCVRREREKQSVKDQREIEMSR